MKVHFIASGEVLMYSIAHALHQNNNPVSGSDDGMSGLTQSGLRTDLIFEPGWFPEKLDHTVDAVVIGNRIKEDNPELNKARELGLKIFSYPEFLYEYSRNKTRVVIAGSPGKTTIASMILHVLHYHSKQIDFFLNTIPQGFESAVNLTDTNDFILFEGSEHGSSTINNLPEYLSYKPNIALISGIFNDYSNGFKTNGNSNRQFEIFIDSIINGGILVYNEEDVELVMVVEKSTNPIRKHGYSTPDYRVENHITVLDTPEGEMEIEVLGAHNLKHISGAKWICQHMGVDEDDFYEAIATFKDSL